MANINTATRRRQWMISGIVAVAGAAIAGGLTWYGHYSKEKAAPVTTVAPDLTGALVTQNFAESVERSALSQQQGKTSTLENDLNNLKQQQAEQKLDFETKLKQLGDLIGRLQTQTPPTQAVVPPITPPGTLPSGPGQPPGPVAAGPGRPAQWNIIDPAHAPGAGQGNGFYGGAPAGGRGNDSRTGGLSSQTFTYASLQAPKPRLPWIPSGSFSEAVMIEGADANASVTGQQNTSAVVFTLIGEVSMPNGKTYSMDQCRVTGEIYGDISSERGEVRTKYISCVMKNGKHVDMGFEGHVSFQGKQGIRGKPVMRNGAIIANAGMAGLLSGFGEGIKSAATPSVGLGASASVSGADVFKQGIGGGASKAADTLSQYWIKRAEQYHPVIDIGAGNLVTVVFQKGFRLTTIEDEEAGKEKEAAPQGSQPAATQTASVNAQVNTPTPAPMTIPNPDEVLRQASQLKLGDTIN